MLAGSAESKSASHPYSWLTFWYSLEAHLLRDVGQQGVESQLKPMCNLRTGSRVRSASPHPSGTAKAAEDAWKLGEAVREAGGDVIAALEAWEPGQLELGRRVLARTRDAGRRSQFEGEWQIGDPLPFGLYEVGDSAMP